MEFGRDSMSLSALQPVPRKISAPDKHNESTGPTEDRTSPALVGSHKDPLPETDSPTLQTASLTFAGPRELYKNGSLDETGPAPDATSSPPAIRHGLELNLPIPHQSHRP
jgi:hypothetical protein